MVTTPHIEPHIQIEAVVLLSLPRPAGNTIAGTGSLYAA